MVGGLRAGVHKAGAWQADDRRLEGQRVVISGLDVEG